MKETQTGGEPAAGQELPSGSRVSTKVAFDDDKAEEEKCFILTLR